MHPRIPTPCDVAIVGLASFYPKSNTLWEYWENILNRIQAVEEVPATHWDWRRYYDPDPKARDKSISKWGGFLSDIPFDPLVFGITPKSIPSIEPLQLLLLEAVRQALVDAKLRPDGQTPAGGTSTVSGWRRLSAWAGGRRAGVGGVWLSHLLAAVGLRAQHIPAKSPEILATRRGNSAGVDRGFLPGHFAQCRLGPGGQPLQLRWPQHGH
jgi:hypothetical protein